MGTKIINKRKLISNIAVPEFSCYMCSNECNYFNNGYCKLFNKELNKVNPSINAYVICTQCFDCFEEIEEKETYEDDESIYAKEKKYEAVFNNNISDYIQKPVIKDNNCNECPYLNDVDNKCILFNSNLIYDIKKFSYLRCIECENNINLKLIE